MWFGDICVDEENNFLPNEEMREQLELHNHGPIQESEFIFRPVYLAEVSNFTSMQYRILL